jgi:hypothetical protein
MAKVINLQVKASTLIEVVIAMVIILIVFALATSIFSGVLRSTPNLREAYIRSVADSMINNPIENKEEESVKVADSLVFQKEITGVAGYSSLFKVTVKVNDGKKEVGRFSRFEKLKDDDK